MFGEFKKLEQKFMDNSFDLFSLSFCDKSPYISPLYPIQSRDEPYNIGLVNCQKNNFDLAIILQEDNSSINTYINTELKNNGFNQSIAPVKKKPGRKRKDKSEIGVHTKNSEDNIIKKIKTYFMKYLHKILNDSIRFAFPYKTFYRLTSKITKNLKKDDNIRLMNMTIREIYEENLPWGINDPSVKDKNYNLVQEICHKNDDTKTKEILNAKYIDLLKTLEAKEYICKEIEKKIRKSNDKIEHVISYMNKLRNLLEDFKEWFTKKHERKNTSKQNENNGKIKNN